MSSTALPEHSLQLLTFIFWKAPSCISLRLWHFDLQPQLEIHQQHQVKQRSGTSVFVQRSCWANFDCNVAASTHSNEICEFESLIRRQDKNLPTKESALANSFLFDSFLSETIWYVEICSTWYFGSSCFVTVWLFKLFLLSTEPGTRKNCSISGQTDNDGK